MAEQRYCEKCRKTMADTNFYTYKDGSKCELCKNCVTMHIDNWDSDTFLWLLEKFDVPYIPPEWNILRDRAYAKDPYKITGMSVFGKYLSKMKLKQWKGYTWADTDRLQVEAEEKARAGGKKAAFEEAQEMATIKEAFENGEITEAQYKTYTEINAPEPHFETAAPPNGLSSSPYPVNDSPFEKIDIIDLGADLTQEDKIYLAMKWGRLYAANDWIELEKLYNEFMDSFDIQGAARIDTLKLICKTSLKMNQAIDCGDVDTYQKLSRVYDSMMKAAKFTEAQNKENGAVEFSSIGEIVAFCEKTEGFIPRHDLDVDLDIVDKVIRDLKEYNNTLIKEDPTIAQQIEQYIKKKEINDEIENREKLLAEDSTTMELDDEDILEYRDNLANQKAEDGTFFNSLLAEEEEY